MKISSYNITDVSYHYIGLKVLGAHPIMPREDAEKQIALGVQKYTMDRALRLMLPEPRGTFQSVGEKVLTEFRHFGFLTSARGVVQLSPAGRSALALLEQKQFVHLRRLMIQLHLSTYSNLRSVMSIHLDGRRVNRPVMDGFGAITPERLSRVLKACMSSAGDSGDSLASDLSRESPKRIEDAITELVISEALPDESISVPLFRSIVDRCMSLRLINQSRVEIAGAAVLSTYSTCRTSVPGDLWYTRLAYAGNAKQEEAIYLSEFDIRSSPARERFLASLRSAFQALPEQGGYHDLPDMRDRVCAELMIPEAAFDEAVNELLTESTPLVSPGLRYEGISSRRRPLLRAGDGSQIYNLLRLT